MSIRLITIVIAACCGICLLLESKTLLRGVIELGIRVAILEAIDEELEPVVHRIEGLRRRTWVRLRG